MKTKEILLYIFALIIFIDPIRAYTNIPFLGLIGPLKELYIIFLLIVLYFNKDISKIRISTYNFFPYICIFVSYIFINSFRANDLVSVIANLKYYFWYLGTILILTNYKRESLEKVMRFLAFLFLLYAIITSLQQILFPSSVRLIGRGGGTANPSILAFLYFSFALFLLYRKERLFFVFFFVVAALLTFTKTYFVSLILSTLLILIFSNLKIKIWGFVIIIMLSVSTYIVISQNEYLNSTFNTAFRIVTYQERANSNTFEQRKNRIPDFINNNNFSPIFGAGFSKAGNATDFVRNKLGKEYGNKAANAESMIFNTYLSNGILGLFLLYYPVLFMGIMLLKKHLKTKKREYLFLLAFLIHFMIFNITLNMFEGFAQITIFCFFFVLILKVTKENNS